MPIRASVRGSCIADSTDEVCGSIHLFRSAIAVFDMERASINSDVVNIASNCIFLITRTADRSFNNLLISNDFQVNDVSAM